VKTGTAANSAPYPYSNARRYSVLLLDDEPDVTSVLKKGLEQQSRFAVYAYNDPEDALRSLSKVDYDIMIVDIRLPKMNGFEFYQKAQRVKDSKVVFITASDAYHEEYQKKYPQWNGNCFIVKPVSIVMLKKFLTSEIAGTRTEREPFN
jgi:DNA-binding response OmpR family regulator